jgi:autotransporter adhesin heptosyltransferase TibC-like protein
VRLSDLDTGNVLFETELKAGRINSTKRYYVRFRPRPGSGMSGCFCTIIALRIATC